MNNITLYHLLMMSLITTLSVKLIIGMTTMRLNIVDCLTFQILIKIILGLDSSFLPGWKIQLPNTTLMELELILFPMLKSHSGRNGLQQPEFIRLVKFSTEIMVGFLISKRMDLTLLWTTLYISALRQSSTISKACIISEQQFNLDKEHSQIIAPWEFSLIITTTQDSWA